VLKIRLSRTGKTRQESFRIVVAEHTNAVKGKYTELVGHYQPATTEKALEIKRDRIEYWMSKGAKPSSTLAALLKKKGFGNMEKYIEIRSTKTKKKGAEEAKADAAKAATPAAPAKAPATSTPPVESKAA